MEPDYPGTTFEIKINGIRTANVNGLENVIRKVDWTLKGTKDSQTFELPQTSDFDVPTNNGFLPLAQVTEANVIQWIETSETRLPSIKAHIHYVLEKEAAKAALTSTPLPWAPVQPTEPGIMGITAQPTT
jgi:hypothetical protein